MYTVQPPIVSVVSAESIAGCGKLVSNTCLSGQVSVSMKGKVSYRMCVVSHTHSKC